MTSHLPLKSLERRNPKYSELKGFKCLSYNIYADCKCMGIKYSSTKLWIVRREILLREIVSYSADILCLQDVDHYYDWWQPRLMSFGYDTLWKQKTSELYTHSEGVMICYRRNMFQLFKSVEIEFNHAADHENYTIQKACTTDDVAVIAFLQPWKENSSMSSAICVCSAMLYDGEGDDELSGSGTSSLDIRFLQTVYLTKQLEIENRSFHLPIILGISLFDEPDSASYHILRTGRQQLMPHPPQKCSRPIVKPFSRASAKIYWKPAQITEADPPVLRYVVAWRPGGNLDLGFCLTKVVQAGDCFEYTTTVNAEGKRVTHAKEMRSVLVNGLSAETPFEFKICAINEIGQGQWSEASLPIVLANPPKVHTSSLSPLLSPPPLFVDSPPQALPKEPLHLLKDLAGVIELAESSHMAQDDWNVQVPPHPLFPYPSPSFSPLPFLTKLNQKAPRVNIYDPQSCTTPRVLSSGEADVQIGRCRVLPLSTNPREGWKATLKGETAMSLKEEILNSKRLKRSVLMTDRGDYRAEVSDTISSRVASYDVEEFVRSRQISRSVTGALSPSHSTADTVSASGSVSRSRRGNGNGNEDSSYAMDEFEDFEEDGTEGGERGDNDTFRYRTGEEGEWVGEEGEREGDEESDFLKEEFSHGSDVPDRILRSSATAPALGNGNGNEKRGLLTSLVMNETTLSTIPQPLESSWDDDNGNGLTFFGMEAQQQQLQQQLAHELAQLNQGGKTARKLNDDVILDLKAAIDHLGARNQRQIHSLNLRSVYESYSIGGEPLFTHSKPADHVKNRGVCCLDYLFISSALLTPMKLLSLPQLTSLHGDDPSQSLISTDLYWDAPPPSFRDLFDNHQRDLQLPLSSQEIRREYRAQEVNKIKEKLTRILRGEREGQTGQMLWGGRWIPFASVNPQRSHSWLPNDSFASSHLALCAYLQINEDYTATQWTSS
jgi:hypothetical protein